MNYEPSDASCEMWVWIVEMGEISTGSLKLNIKKVVKWNDVIRSLKCFPDATDFIYLCFPALVHPQVKV
jgi:hypothetical protein